ncbi:MAG TPA: lipopolysaccharide kinase InaA family protein, partial [Planctomycetota bacterium]|nr:lipopolysaccharide kinase InaA family protein [Planctomycetota bacterium]
MGWIVHWEPGLEGPAGDAGGRLLLDLEGAALVARSRTKRTESGVLRLPAGPVPVHRKVYAYAGWGARIGGAFRTTFAAPSRAAREAAALRRLGALGLAPAPVATAERRVAGFLAEAILATRTVEGGRALVALDPGDGLAAAAGAAAGRLHAAGVVALDLAPRNLVASRGPAGWTIVKVDTARLREGGPSDAARADDLADLLAGLEGRWDDGARAALRDAYAAAAGGLPAGLD